MSKKPTDKQISRVMAELGRRGAKAGHAKRKTPEEKKEYARKLAFARWRKNDAN